MGRTNCGNERVFAFPSDLVASPDCHTRLRWDNPGDTSLCQSACYSSFATGGYTDSGALILIFPSSEIPISDLFQGQISTYDSESYI